MEKEYKSGEEIIDNVVDFFTDACKTFAQEIEDGTKEGKDKGEEVLSFLKEDTLTNNSLKKGAGMMGAMGGIGVAILTCPVKIVSEGMKGFSLKK